MSVPSPEEQVRFLTHLQRLLVEGEFVATYKFALLLALADLSVERGDDSGAELELSTEDIALEFVSYYWRQAVPYQPAGTGPDVPRVLRQNTGAQAVIVRLLGDPGLRESGPLPRVCPRHGPWAPVVREVARTVRVMPLWKLQTVGAGVHDFLYPNVGRGARITLRPGVAYCFRQFHGLVQDLVRGAWVRTVRRFNRDLLGNDRDLSEFLFGSERAALAPVVPVLEAVQDGRCFYCTDRLRAEDVHVDHFIPWARYPRDLGHNFVLAHARCNARKSDHLPSPGHLDAWVERNERHGEELGARFAAIRFEQDLPASVRIVHWAYQTARRGGGLTWVRERELAPLPDGWDRALGRLMVRVGGGAETA